MKNNIKKQDTLLTRLSLALARNSYKELGPIIKDLQEIEKELQTASISKISSKQELVDALRELNENCWSSVLNRGEWPSYIDKEIIRVAGPITVAHTSENGFDSDCHVVFYLQKFDCYIRVDGWYSSEDGMMLQGKPVLVNPKQKIVTVYETF